MKATQAEEAARPYVLVSADGHVGAPNDLLRDYFDPRYRSRFDEYARDLEEGRQSRRRAYELTTRQRVANSSRFVHPYGSQVMWDAGDRTKALDEQGIAAEVVFPDMPHINSLEPPFGLTGGGYKEVPGTILRRSHELYDWALQWAGAQAYNRWLAEFCTGAPHRLAGVGIVPFNDPERAVVELHWLRDHGIVGGVLLPGINHVVRYNDEALEPIWHALEELDLAVNIHGGLEIPDYGSGPDAFTLFAEEGEFYNRRPLWWLIWSGVLERHPRLKLVFVEQDAAWIPRVLAKLDERYRGSADARALVPRLPSEYWTRQCFVAALLTREEVLDRAQIGTETMMWGADYPHPEGSWPKSVDFLRYSCAGVPAGELRSIVGLTAAEVYGFNTTRLEAIAAEIGPRASVIEDGLERPPRKPFPSIQRTIQLAVSARKALKKAGSQ